jgi:hypothetical protein
MAKASDIWQAQFFLLLMVFVSFWTSQAGPKRGRTLGGVIKGGPVHCTSWNTSGTPEIPLNHFFTAPRSQLLMWQRITKTPKKGTILYGDFNLNRQSGLYLSEHAEFNSALPQPKSRY